MPNSNHSNHSAQSEAKRESLVVLLRKASKKIAPLWPLDSFVAVNPYLGLTAKSFNDVAKDLDFAGNIQMTLPAAFYLEKIAKGTLREEHLAMALNNRGQTVEVEDFLRQIENTEHRIFSDPKVSTFADVATKALQKDWKRFKTNRISNWAASYFDNGQAIWTAANQSISPFNAWKEEAEVNLSPEVAGLKGFRKTIKSLPDNALEAVDFALDKLAIPQGGLELYLHTLLLRLGGWAAYVSRLDWDNELYGGKDGKLIEFLAVLVCWEYALLQCLGSAQLSSTWNEATKLLAKADGQKEINAALEQKLILQEAFDISEQEIIINKFKGSVVLPKLSDRQAKAQAIFCIDVRSEVYRRNLEMADAEIETLGFAGFFAFPIKYVPLGHEVGESQCPVLLPTGPTILEELQDKEANQRALKSRLLNRSLQQVWKSFKSGAVTCFSFVSPMGLSYLPKLFSDSYGLTRPVPHPDKVGMNKKSDENRQVSLANAQHNDETAGIPLDQQLQMAKNALNAMSLTDDFAKFVLIVGHGSTMVNNPHATGYDCGACGGHTGESNAKVAVAVLNSPAVRSGLQKDNIHIPLSTVFLACLHDTTTDELSIYNEHEVPSDRKSELKELKASLQLAGQTTRMERSLRLKAEKFSDIDKSILMRSKDWSQTRPEWGLAGCSAFVVAPRERSKGIDFAGRSFLHSYDWKKDEGFGVLELIMTAPMVVTSWISLQYFASTVDNKVHGSGNKTLHNVTAGLGVLEGFSGDLRTGLPWQAVHDGENYQHEPVKLNVIIEAPMDAMNAVLAKHKGVKDLCDNGWLHLLAMDESGKVSHRYAYDLKWDKVTQAA